MSQLISIDQEGNIETLKQKRGKGIDLREHGKIALKRITTIELDEGSQKFYITFLLGDLKGRTLDVKTYAQLTGDGSPTAAHSVPGCATLLTPNVIARKSRELPGAGMSPTNLLCSELQFTDYEDAVACEIAVIQKARELGLGHLVGSADEPEAVKATDKVRTESGREGKVVGFDVHDLCVEFEGDGDRTWIAKDAVTYI